MRALRMPAPQLGWVAIVVASCSNPRSDPARMPDRDLSYATDERTTEVIELHRVSATEVVKTLEDLLEASRQASARRIGPGSCVLYPPGAHPTEPEPSAKFVALANSNAIRIQAPPDDLPRIRELVARLDGVAPKNCFEHLIGRR